MSRATPRFQPQVTALEDRTVMSSYYSYVGSGTNYTYHVGGMPDFDQRRTAAGSTPGLAGGGNNHCVPTAATNVMAFLANHGHPSLMPGYGARNWQAAANYNPATVSIAAMGGMMETSATTGTNSTDGPDGLQTWLNAFCPGKFTSGRISTKDTNKSTVDLMTALASQGVLVMPVVGWYAGVGNQFVRVGGHAVTLTDAKGSFGLLKPKTIGVNDPAWEQNSTTANQSAFKTNNYTVTAQLAYFDGVAQFKEKVNGLTGSGTTAYLDGFYFVDPKAGTYVTSKDTTSAGSAGVAPAGNLAADFANGVTVSAAAPAAVRANETGAVLHAAAAAPARVAEAAPAAADDDFEPLLSGVAVDAEAGLWFAADPAFAA